jgi:hypothetical protein
LLGSGRPNRETQRAIVGTPQQIERALREAKDGGVSGVNVLSSALLFALRGYIINPALEATAAALGLKGIFIPPPPPTAFGIPENHASADWAPNDSPHWRRTI